MPSALSDLQLQFFQNFVSDQSTANPAAGQEISITVPAGVIWKVKSVRYTLVTSAAVANRQSNLIIDDGVTTVLRIPADSVQAASITRGYNWAQNMPSGTKGGESTQPLPNDLILGPGWRIRTSTDLIDVGDDYSAGTILVEVENI